MLKPTCSKCGVALLLEAAVQRDKGLQSIGIFLNGEALMNRIIRLPRSCPHCQKNFCTACTIEAGTGHGDTYYVCPNCGRALGSFYTKPMYVHY